MRRSVSWALAVALAVGAAELAARVALAQPGLHRALGRRGGHGLWVSNHEAARAMGPDAILGAPFDPDPELGWVMRPSVALAQPWRLHTDRWGLRLGPDREPGAGPQPSVMVLGDSFAFGADVHDEETFAARLAGAVPEALVLNLGVVGYGHDQMLGRYLRDGRAWAPAVVVVLLVDCDLYRNEYAFTAWHKPRYERVDGGLRQVATPPASLDQALGAYARRPRLLDALTILREAADPSFLPADFRPPTEDTLALARALLDELATRARGDGASPVLLYAPLPGVARSSLQSVQAAPTHRLFEAMCADGPWARCVDATPAVIDAVAGGAPVTPPEGAHWSGELHDVIARELAPTVEELLPRSGP